MIITIDGPAGAGKSTVARGLANALGFAFLDTGAMYRAVTLAALRRNAAWDDDAALEQVAGSVRIELADGRVWLDGADVSEAIRRPEVTRRIRHVADNPRIRSVLNERQRALAAEAGDVVTEGRDQGTDVFPDAGCKIFLTASSEARARRRQADLAARGVHLDLERVLEEQERRDAEDQQRPVGALRPAPDAIRVVTDGLSEPEVVERLRQLVAARARSAC